MRHRHLSDDTLTAAAIDDIVARGSMADWIRLRDAIRADAALARRTSEIARAAVEHDRDQRRLFWAMYAARYAR